jgi:hypothetical protein
MLQAMSSPPSETETLLATPPDYDYTDHEQREHDRPVQVGSFMLNVKRCKAFLGLLVPVVLGLGAWHYSMIRGAKLMERPSGDINYQSWNQWADVVGASIIVSPPSCRYQF